MSPFVFNPNVSFSIILYANTQLACVVSSSNNFKGRLCLRYRNATQEVAVDDFFISTLMLVEQSYGDMVIVTTLRGESDEKKSVFWSMLHQQCRQSTKSVDLQLKYLNNHSTGLDSLKMKIMLKCTNPSQSYVCNWW